MEKNRNLTGLVIGIILITAGVLSLFGNVFPFLNWEFLWPLFVIGVGAVFFLVMLFGDQTRSSLAVPGSIIGMVGLILLVLNYTQRWEAWSYAWALIISAAGFGTWASGMRSDQPELRARGLKTIREGLVLFVILGAILEGIFTISGGPRLGSTLLWAALLALLGLYLLVSRLLQLSKGSRERVDLFWPVVMIGAGSIAILAEMGWLPEGNLLALFNLWPLLLIVAGLDLVFRSRPAWVGASLGVIVVAVIFVTAFAGDRLGLRSTPFWSFDTNIFQIGDLAGERINGSGLVVTESRTVSGFDRIALEIPATLQIQQGIAESVTVSTDDNILPFLLTEVTGDKLTIRFKPGYNIRTNRRVQVSIIVKDLKELHQGSSGNVEVGLLRTGDFRLTSSSSGDIQFEEIQAGRLTTDLSSSGNIKISGSANQLDLDVKSSGDFQAGDLQVQDAIIRVASSGNVTVWVLKNLTANISSSGNIYYYGSPNVAAPSLTSSGKLVPKGEK